MTAPPFNSNRGFLAPDRLEFALGLTVRGTLKGFVYQKTSALFANAATRWDKLRQKRRLVIPYDPKTTPQLAQRSKMTIAVAAWKALPEEDRLAYNRIRSKYKYLHRTEGRKTYVSGYQYFLSLHMKGEIE